MVQDTPHGTTRPFIPRVSDLSAQGADLLEADYRARTVKSSREAFVTTWMTETIARRAWTCFNLQTSATLKSLHGA